MKLVMVKGLCQGSEGRQWANMRSEQKGELLMEGSLGGVSHLQSPYNESQSQFEEGSLGLHLSLGTLETVLC